MKKLIKIWTVADGQIKEIKFEDGDIYEVQRKKQVEEPRTTMYGSVVKPKKISRVQKTASTRKHLEEMGVHFLRKSQGLRIIKEAVNELKAKSLPESIKVLRKYYPKVKKDTLKNYYSKYRKYMDKKKREKPSDCMGYDDTYKTWIKKEDYHNIYKKITAINYRDKSKCTSENLAKETGLGVQRTRATLHYMLDNGKIKQSFNEDGRPRYHP